MDEKKTKMEELSENIVEVILSYGLSYGETMSAINRAQNYLQGKHFNLANAVNIREVAKWKR